MKFIITAIYTAQSSYFNVSFECWNLRFFFSGHGCGFSKENILLLVFWGLDLEIWASSWPSFPMTHNFCSSWNECQLRKTDLNFYLEVGWIKIIDLRLSWMRQTMSSSARGLLGLGAMASCPRSASDETPPPPLERELLTFTKCFYMLCILSSPWPPGPGWLRFSLVRTIFQRR